MSGADGGEPQMFHVIRVLFGVCSDKQGGEGLRSPIPAWVTRKVAVAASAHQQVPHVRWLPRAEPCDAWSSQGRRGRSDGSAAAPGSCPGTDRGFPHRTPPAPPGRTHPEPPRGPESTGRSSSSAGGAEGRGWGAPRIPASTRRNGGGAPPAHPRGLRGGAGAGRSAGRGGAGGGGPAGGCGGAALRSAPSAPPVAAAAGPRHEPGGAGGERRGAAPRGGRAAAAAPLPPRTGRGGSPHR